MGTSHVSEPPVAKACGRCGQTKTRQTTHHQDDQVSTVVTRKRHPFEGCRLPVIRSLTRRGVLEFLVILPDGSRTLIPVAWTDRNGCQNAELMSLVSNDRDAAENLCTISDLLKARGVTDALLSRLVESAPEQEGDDAVRIGVSRTARGAGRRSKGSLGPDRSAGSDRRPCASFAAHCAKAGCKAGTGGQR